jgi:hypothetical protein
MKTTSLADAKIEEVFLAPVGAAFGNRTIVIERAGWYQVITPGSPFGNEVVLSRIEPSRAEHVVREVIRQYAELGVPFRWQVGPLTQPADLGDVLARHGFVGTDVRGMAIEPAAAAKRPRSAAGGATIDPAADAKRPRSAAGGATIDPAADAKRPRSAAGGATIDPAAWTTTPSDVVVERVTRDNLADYVTGVAEGWRDETAPDPNLADDVSGVLDGEQFCFLVAKVGGALAGTAAYTVKPRSAYLTGGNVLPAFRGRGVYRALIDTRLRMLAAAGCPLATTQGREKTSAPILEHLGWETVCRFRVYRLADPRVAT